MNVVKKIFFVGDPQFSSKKPRYRIEDNDADWMLKGFNKLRFINQKAIEERAQIYILGDLTEFPQDMHPDLMAFLFEEASKAKNAGLTWRIVWGNHDMVDTKPTTNTVIGVLSMAGMLIDFKTSAIQETLTLRPEGGGIVNVEIGATPFGMELPKEVHAFNNEKVFWLTHMDVALDDSPYPGAEEPFEIPGIDMIVNGHDHHTKTIKYVGQTGWLTTGNILRRKRSDRDHRPVFFEWDPSMKDPQPIYLDVDEEVFDMTGKLVKAAKNIQNNQFIESLKKNITEAKASNHNNSVEFFKEDFRSTLDVLRENKKISSETVAIFENILSLQED